MDELRCDRILHMTAKGPVVERLCRSCSYKDGTTRVSVFHRWKYQWREGEWIRTKDRVRRRRVAGTVTEGTS